MSPSQTVTSVDCQTVSETFYDVVIVGSGVAGAIVAKELSQQGKTVLILEAGKTKDLTIAGFQSYVDTFYSAVAKDANSPYPKNPNALSPNDIGDYFVERGPNETWGFLYTGSRWDNDALGSQNPTNVTRRFQFTQYLRARS